MLPEQDATLELVRKILSTGISCLTVHCRTQTMRDREPAMLHRLRDIVEVGKEFGVPVVANGDCFGTQDQERICELTGEWIRSANDMVPGLSLMHCYCDPVDPGVTSIMIARGAEDNPSCFAPKLADPLSEILPLYTKLAVHTNNAFQNTKYCIYQMDLSKTSKAPEAGMKQIRVKFRNELSHLKTYEGLCDLLDIDYDACKAIKSIEEILPGLEQKLKAQNEEIYRETQDELKTLERNGHADTNGEGAQSPNQGDDCELPHKNDKHVKEIGHAQENGQPVTVVD